MPQPDKPNVLFIAIDDLRPFLGCYGDPNAYTPNIDKLAARGITFTNAMCTSPCCGPSRASLMTGQLPTQTGLYGFQNWAGRKAFEDKVTLPEYFRQQDYKTFASGKIHHNSKEVHSINQHVVDENMKSSEPDQFLMVPRANREWDVNNVKDIINSRYNHDPVFEDSIDWSGRPIEKQGDLGNVKLVSGPSDDDISDCQDWITAQFGETVLKQNHDKPFFLATGFVRPHLPFIAPRKYFEHYPLDSLKLIDVKEDDLADSPWEARANAKVGDDIRIRKADPKGRAKVIQAYYACVSFVDDMIGKVLTALENSEYADNTVIVFWSDHGWHLGEKRSWRKFSLWEESARTPMIIVDPRKSETAGQACSRPVGLIDIYPTLTDMCGIGIPDGLDGTSLNPLLTNPEASDPQFTEPEITIHGRGNYSLRDEEWRYTHYYKGGEELYHHKSDPLEWKNLADDPDYADVKARMATFLPKESVPSVEPRGLACSIDQDYDDLEEFKNNVWPKWMKQATPALI